MADTDTQSRYAAAPDMPVDRRGTSGRGVLARSVTLRRKHGWSGLVRRVFSKLRWQLLALWRRVFQHRNCVFVHEGTADTKTVPGGRTPEGLTILRCTDFGDLPLDVRAQLVARRDRRSLEVDAWELRHGAVQWLALIDGRLAGTSMSRRGRHFAKWFVPLHDDDIVIFRNGTMPEFRGRGVCPGIMRHVIGTELSEGGRAYVDCRVFNKSSIRSIEKAGFRRIATMRPLRRGEAVRALENEATSSRAATDNEEGP